MHALRGLAGAAVVAALGVAGTVAPAGAASDTHITGSFTGLSSQGCVSGDPSSWGPVTGTWRLNVGTHTASARFSIYLQGAPHAVYTMPLDVVTNNGSTVVATGTTAAGSLEVTIAGTTMTYVIAPYDSRTFPDHQAYCPAPNGSVTYTGTVTGAV